MAPLTPLPRIKLSRLRDIGWALWDPIGLLRPEQRWDDEDCLSFADEYDRYLIGAASQLRRGASDADVVAELVWVETVHMDLRDRDDAPDRAQAVVDAIRADDQLWTWPDEHGRFPS